MYRKLGATGVFLATTLWAQSALAICISELVIAVVVGVVVGRFQK